jgi:hypothetical protein
MGRNVLCAGAWRPHLATIHICGHFISGLMAHRVPFLVAELGADVILHKSLLPPEKEKYMPRKAQRYGGLSPRHWGSQWTQRAWRVLTLCPHAALNDAGRTGPFRPSFSRETGPYPPSKYR